MTNEEFIKSVSLEGEEWLDVFGFEGLYKVSSLGRVVSLAKYVNNRFKNVYKEPRLLMPHNNGESTQSVLLSKDGVDRKYHIPKLVASTFIPNPNCCKAVRMIDGDNKNYRVSNLEWIVLKDRRKKHDTSSLDGEIWKDIPKYEGLYKISSLGRIISSYSRRILSPIISGHKGKDYYAITLVKNGIKKRFHIHKLVALSFIPNPDRLPCIDHINTDRYDNRVENLKWCSFSQNNLNPITNSKRLKPVVQLKDGLLTHVFNSISEATKYGFCLGQIINCCKGRNKHHKGFQWMYLSDYETLINKSKNSSPND